MKKDESILEYKCSSGKGIHYSLITLIELADNYYCGGCSLTYISKRNDIPLYILMPIISKMKEAGLIECREDNNDWLFLNKEPHNTWIFEMISTLKILFKEWKITK